MYVNIMSKGETEDAGLCSAIRTQAHILKWSALRCWTPRSAEMLALAEEHFWVAENGGRLPSLSERLPVLPDI